MNKKKILMIGMFLLVSVVLINIVSASVCCEKTKVKDDGTGGAWCQSIDDEDDCAEGFQISKTGCESTTYCKMGTCVDNEQGICSPNSPQKNCDGLWIDKGITEISQCEEACCVLGTTSFMDTLGGCKKQAEIFGIGIDFRKDIKNELECSLLSRSNVKGACVFGDELDKTCRFLSEKECLEMDNLESDVSFYRDTLCSAAKLEITCGPSKKTTCNNGQVYFVDSCGNLANIYDSARQDDSIYWTNIYDESEVTCDDGNGNKNSATCGICENRLGSSCGLKQTGDASPIFGDNLCRSLDCGNGVEHGDKWCALEADGNKGTRDNLPGSEHIILECRNGKIDVVEECSVGEYRNKICIDSEVGGVPNAGCVVNTWHDCTEQRNRKDCLNEDRRDCSWVEDEFDLTEDQTDILCIPKNAPGFDFWNIESKEATNRCAKGSKTVKVTYKKGVPDFKWKAKGNTWANGDAWKQEMNKVCQRLGDCGMDVNYIGKEGYYNISDLWSRT